MHRSLTEGDRAPTPCGEAKDDKFRRGIGDLLVLPDPQAIRRLSEIEVPTLVVVGERDNPDNRAIAGLLEERLERATKVTVGGAGHMVNMEKPEEFDRIVLSFLEGRFLDLA